jgi:hypothetical protein
LVHDLFETGPVHHQRLPTADDAEPAVKKSAATNLANQEQIGALRLDSNVEIFEVTARQNNRFLCTGACPDSSLISTTVEMAADAEQRGILRNSSQSIPELTLGEDYLFRVARRKDTALVIPLYVDEMAVSEFRSGADGCKNNSGCGAIREGIATENSGGSADGDQLPGAGHGQM